MRNTTMQMQKNLLFLLFGLGFCIFLLTCAYLREQELNTIVRSNETLHIVSMSLGDSFGSQGRRLEFPNNLVVVYNRVPKTGSTSFTGLAYDLCSRNKFNILHLNTTKNSHVLSLADQMRFAQNITRWTEKHPALYHGHLAYFDFTAFGVDKPPLFINIVREPIDRLVSYYYFLRFGDDFRPHLNRRRQGDRRTFDECVVAQGKDCDPDVNMWLQVPFFCGHAATCWEPPGNEWALAQAKRNLVDKYFLVGVTEELEDFVTLLEAVLPSMFRGASDLYLRGEKSHLRRTFNKTTPSAETLRTLQSSPVYKAESEFYQFAYQQFQALKKRTLLVKADRLVEKGQQYFYEKIRPRSRDELARSGGKT